MTQHRSNNATTPSTIITPDDRSFFAKGQYFVIFLFGIFIILILLGLWMGTSAFKSITNMQNTTDDERLALNSLQNRVRASDTADSFSVQEGPEGPAIVFSMELETGTYETRLYHYQGYIVEELAFSTDPYLPEIATKIVASDTFDFTYENNLLTVTTDQGTLNVSIRSGASTTYPTTTAEGGQDA